MDLTPDVLHEQEFREARRGYDMREVDDFLERVAVAVGQLLERLSATASELDAARSRIDDLEERVRAAESGSGTPEDTLQRTLVLAQKTADAAIAEAEEQAARIVGRAEQQAASVQRDAEQSAERLRIEAESQARRAGEETRRRMLDEITSLERSREALSSDVRALRRFLDDQRTRMRTAARDLLRLVEDPTAMKAFEPPVLSDHDPSDDRGDPDGAPPGDPESAADDAAPGADAGPLGSGGGEVEGDDANDEDYFDDLRRAMSEEQLDAEAPSDA